MNNSEQTILFYDTETSGFRSKSKSYDDPTQAWVVQLAWILSKGERVLSTGAFIVQPRETGRSINPKAAEVHGISMDDIKRYGLGEETVITSFINDCNHADLMVCHNYAFDIEFLKDMIARNLGVPYAIDFAERPHYCTMKESTDYCELPHKTWKSFKYPKLIELYDKLFGETFDGAHDALIDVSATRRCYYEMKKLGM